MKSIRSPGQFLVGGIAFLAAVMIVCQAMVYFTQHETAWTVKSNSAASAYNLASAGYERALWKLKENRGNYDTIIAGTPLAGYNNDKIYTDVPGGSYRIYLSSEATGQRIDILTTGKSKGGKEYSSILATVDRAGEGGGNATAAVYAQSLSINGTFLVHWGPINTVSTMNLGSGADQLYPRKFSRSSILASGVYPSRSTSNVAPNTDGIEWWSYNTGRGVPNSPSINLAYYKNVAIQQGNYYTKNNTVLKNVVNTDATQVYYFKGKGQLIGTNHFRGVLISESDITFAGAGLAPQGNITVTPSTAAYLEYQKNTPASGTLGGVACAAGGAGAVDDGIYNNGVAADGDSACVDQYPGDGGLHTSESYTIGAGCAAHASLSGGLGQPAEFWGFVYAGGNLIVLNPTTIFGALQVQGGSLQVASGANLELYYDSTGLVQTTQMSGTEFSLISWQTVPAAAY